MRTRHMVAVMIVLAVTACGSSGDDDQAVATDPGAPTAATTSTTGAQPPTTGAPRVTSFVLGTAVGTVEGGDDPEEQAGELKREDQRCYGEERLDGLEAGASVTVREAASGTELGRGTIESTSAVQIDSESGAPTWECSFQIRVAMPTTPASITVQVADLPPWPAEFDGVTFAISISDPSAASTTLPDSTAPPLEVGTPPTEP